MATTIFEHTNHSEIDASVVEALLSLNAEPHNTIVLKKITERDLIGSGYIRPADTIRFTYMHNIYTCVVMPDGSFEAKCQHGNRYYRSLSKWCCEVVASTRGKARTQKNIWVSGSVYREGRHYAKLDDLRKIYASNEGRQANRYTPRQRRKGLHCVDGKFIVV